MKLLILLRGKIVVKIAALLIGSLVLMTNNHQALAQKGTSRIQGINSSHYIPPLHSKINKAVANKNFTEVTRLLNELEVSSANLSVSEQAYNASYHGKVCYSLDDFDCALNQYKKIISMRTEINEGLYSQSLYIVTQVYIAKDEYREGLAYAKLFLKSLDKPGARDYVLIGQLHYMLKEYEEALPWSLIAIEKEMDSGNNPKESDLNLLYFIYENTDQLEKLPPVLHQLIKYYPKDVYQQRLNKVDEILKQ